MKENNRSVYKLIQIMLFILLLILAIISIRTQFRFTDRVQILRDIKDIKFY